MSISVREDDRVPASRPKVSVVMQFLNAARYLEDAVRSVLWQTFTEWELVELILDGYAKSPGNSSSMIARSVLLESEELIGVAEEVIADDQFLWSFVARRHAILVNPEPPVRYRQWPGFRVR